MLSPLRYRIDDRGRITRTTPNPHVMFYGPNLTDADIGGLRGSVAYIDSQAQNPAEELMKLGGAAIILATATSGKAFAAVLGGLAIDGKMIVVGAADPLEVSPMHLLGGRRSIVGWPSGRSIDSQDTLRFSALTGVRSMNEVFPLDRAAEAYERMMSGKAVSRGAHDRAVGQRSYFFEA